MSSYRIDPTRIRFSETEPRKRNGRSLVFMGELGPAVESAAPTSRQMVAVKTRRQTQNPQGFNPTFKSFAYELSLMTALSHPNIVKLIGFVEDKQEHDARMIVSWEGNGDVQEFLQSGEWDIPERVSLIQDAVCGLEYLHTREPPIRHGDLQSMHILVNSFYRAVITGFGGARIMSKFRDRYKDDHWLRSLCEVGYRRMLIFLKADVSPLIPELEISLGKLEYNSRRAAPELLSGGSPDLPGDTWAFGWVCWEIVTGEIPFPDDKDYAVMMRVLKGDLPAIREHAELCQVLQLCDLMSGCWTRDTAKRMDVSTFRKKARFLPSTIPSGCTSGQPKVRSADHLLELGKMYDLQNDTVAAESQYQLAIDVATRDGNGTIQANALIGLGDTYDTRSMYPEAEEAFKEAHAIHSRISDVLGAAKALIGLGRIHYFRSRYPEAEEIFTEAREIHARIGDTLGVANSLIGLGEVYCVQSRYPEAEQAFKDAHEIHSSIGNDRGAANASAGLGDIYNARSRYSEAEEVLKEAHSIHSRIGNNLGVAKALIGLGEVYDAQSRCFEAEKAFRGALEIHARLRNDLGVANALIGMGKILDTRQRYCEAEKAFKEAREIHSRIGNDRGTAAVSVGLGRIYNALSRYSEAEESLTEAHEIYSRIGNNVGVANTLIGLGEVYKSQSRYSEAEKAFRDAHKLHSLIGNDLGVANVLIGLGDIYGAQSSYPEAEKAFTGAHEIHFRIGNYVRAANAVVSLGEVYDAQSRYFEAEVAFKKVPEILSRIGNNLSEADSLNDRGESDVAQSGSGDSGDEEYSEEAAELHLRDETSIGQSETLTEIKFGPHAVDFKEEEPFEEVPEIHPRIHNDSGNASAVDNPQQANFIQELASTIESVSMPSTQYIVNLILALARTAPTAIRNKHQLYRILIISRDICYHLHRMAHTEDESSSGLNVLETYWEIMDNLERTLLELIGIISQETVPFGALSIATWNNSRTGLSRIYDKLTAPPFYTFGIENSASAMWDRYFDDCSWLSLLLIEGIEIPIRSMHPGVGEEGISIQKQNIIDRLKHVVNETKLNGNTNEPTRKLFIKILSDVANVMTNGRGDLSVDFWNTAERALQVIDLEKGLDQDLVNSLRNSWTGFVDRQIQQALTLRLPTPPPPRSQDYIAVSLPQELTVLNHEMAPATEPLVSLLDALGREAPMATRNKHKIYAVVSRARDICNDIFAISERTEAGGLETLDEYYSLIDALEGVLLDVASLLPAEQVSFGREMCVSWPERREKFDRILNRLHEPPFQLDPSAPKQELTKNSVFDDHYWLSLLLEEGIEKELGQQHLDIEMPPEVVSVREGLQYLENEIKCGYHEETTRELVIDIATQLYEAMSTSAAEKGSDFALPIRTAEPPAPIRLDKDTLVTSLSIAFSALDLDSSLESQDIDRLTGNWWGISRSSPRIRPGNLGENKPAETGLSGQVESGGWKNQETPQDPAQSQRYWHQLHKIISRRNLAYSTDMAPRDSVRNENWVVTIHITGEAPDTLRLTGAGLSKREAKEAVARLALIVFGDIVYEE